MAFGEARVRVRYAETDQMGVVYYANYLVWFEVGRVELIRAMGLDYKRMEIEDECGLAVAEATCRYKAPARYDDVLIVKTRILEVRGSVVKFGYEIVREKDGVTLCEGATTHVAVGRDMKRCALPAPFVEVFRAAHVPAEVPVA